MEDKEIINLYLSRNEQAVAETKCAYAAYIFSIAKNILDCDEDAEEVVADTLLQAWNSIPPQRPKNLKIYLARIARNLALSKWRRISAQKRGGGQALLSLAELGECIADGGDLELVSNKEELAGSINRFLACQSQRDRAVFLRRYFFMEDTQMIVRRFGIREANVFQILSRMRRKLKDYLTKEGYYL